MNTEIYIENYPADITNDLSSLITFALDSLRDFSERETSWSKSIILPGTANNNKLFGHIFEVGQSNLHNASSPNIGYNFNAAKSANCIIFQDQIQTFKGRLRILQIISDKGRIEYSVQVVGELSGLNVSLSSYKLEDIDFSAYNHSWNYTNIVNSWNTVNGSGYYYPLIDFGNYSVGKHDWDIRTFRPAFYVKEYIDKMFAAAGYRYSSDLFNTTRFKSLIIPHNQKKLYKLNNQLVTGTQNSDKVYPTGLNTAVYLEFDSATLNNFTKTSNYLFTYTGANPITVRIQVSYPVDYASDDDIYCTLEKNSSNLAVQYLPASNGASATITFDVTTTFSNGDTLFVEAAMGGNATYWDLTAIAPCTISITSATAVQGEANPGDSLVVNEAIPKNIRQIDFLVSIVKLFNLYVYEDKNDPRLIYFKPYVDFYSTDSTNAVDWSYKLNRDKPITIVPMSEITAKKYAFKYKQDNDYWNEIYFKRYGEGYGSYTYDSQYEFSEQIKSLELIFSATPLVGYGGEDKVYSTIFKRTGSDSSPVEENVDCNIRILQAKKVTGVSSWDIKDGSTVLTSITDYGYAGHFDDPDAPSNDLNFGALRELFFTLATGNLSNTQFNVYWSSYMAEITDKDSKLLSARFYLTPKDIVNLDFSKQVYLDGILFKLAKIEDYNLTIPSDCKVELLKTNYLLY